MTSKRIQSALISVFNKEGLDDLVRLMSDMGIVIYSTGGTKEYIENLGVAVVGVEEITHYPSILGGRVKTLHPKVFGGILAMRNDDHLSQLSHFQIPLIDLVIVDLYPFEDTIQQTKQESEIIEKIDIGGISLIRAAAKNHHDVVVIPSKNHYPVLQEILKANGITSFETRKQLAIQAFEISSNYDKCIFEHLANLIHPLRYGENPHQTAEYVGNITECFDILGGKELSYNNILDIDAAIQLIKEFYEGLPCFAILKHNNVCGIAQRDSLIQAWKDALAGDPVSAFGGILICNKEVDVETAQEVNALFYEVLLAPSFSEEAAALLSAKKQRILIRIKKLPVQDRIHRSVLNGELRQDVDTYISTPSTLKVVTKRIPDPNQMDDLVFASTIVKHLKSNAITLVINKQLIGMGCGQTSRVEACRQAIDKAKAMGFVTKGAAMASEAFFPFPDCVELAASAGINCIIQPGGSMNDQKSIQKADELEIAMVFSGTRHFKH